MKITYYGAKLTGFDHPYNTTALNERTVEIAVVKHWLGGKVTLTPVDTAHVIVGPALELEVGNVLGHYGIHAGEVVDKYETGSLVTNKDVEAITGSYRTIVSISTLEHAGHDAPEELDMGKSVRAVRHLRSLLAPGGRMLITAPMGHHRDLDAAILEDALECTRSCTFVRTADGGWAQTARPVWARYGASTEWAEAVWVGEWENAA